MSKWKAAFVMAAAISVMLFVIVIAGCHKETVNTVEPSSSAELSTGIQSITSSIFKTAIEDTLLGEDTKLVTPANGGTLQISSSKFMIPPGAVATATPITFKILTIDPPKGLKDAPKRVIRFSPAGLVFLAPCTLEIKLDDLGLDTLNINSSRNILTCFYYNPLSKRYEPQPTIHQKGNGIGNRKYLVTINHFSAYAFGRLNED